jgi:hypothetical protein
MPKERKIPNRLDGALVLLVGGIPEHQESREELSDGQLRELQDQTVRVQE